MKFQDELGVPLLFCEHVYLITTDFSVDMTKHGNLEDEWSPLLLNGVTV